MKLGSRLHRWRLWWSEADLSGWVQRVTCRIFGHQIIDDQCGLPEHRHCAWCDRANRDWMTELRDNPPKREGES